MLVWLRCNNQEPNRAILKAECSLISFKYQGSVIYVTLSDSILRRKWRNLHLVSVSFSLGSCYWLTCISLFFLWHFHCLVFPFLFAFLLHWVRGQFVLSSLSCWNEYLYQLSNSIYIQFKYPSSSISIHFCPILLFSWQIYPCRLSGFGKGCIVHSWLVVTCRYPMISNHQILKNFTRLPLIMIWIYIVDCRLKRIRDCYISYN